MQKNNIISILILALLLGSCSSNNESEVVPYEMQPKGLQKKIEAELISKSKEKIKELMWANNNLILKYPSEIFCGLDNHITIQRNNTKQIMVRDKVIRSKEEIQDGIFLYYTANADLNQAQIEKNIQDSKYKFFNYPFHSRISLKVIEEKIEETLEELAQAKEGRDENLIVFYQNALEEWKRKLKTILTLEVDELIEIQAQAFVQIEDATNKKGLSPLTEEAIQGILNLRNYAARKYFQTSYYSLYFDASRNNDTLAQKKVDAIDYLYQIRIIDESYAEINGIQTFQNSRISLFEEVNFAPPPRESIIKDEK